MLWPQSLHLCGYGSSGELRIGGRIHIHQYERCLCHHPKHQWSLRVIGQHGSGYPQTLFGYLNNSTKKHSFDISLLLEREKYCKLENNIIKNKKFDILYNSFFFLVIWTFDKCHHSMLHVNHLLKSTISMSNICQLSPASYVNN